MEAMDLEVSSDTSGSSAPMIIEHENPSAEDWDIPSDIGFDYESIGDPIARQEAIDAAERINGRLRKSLEEYVAIGFDLIKVKESIGYGNFQRWIDAEFGMTHKTATNYMSVANRFGKPEIISTLSAVPPTALIHLASAPDEVQEEILAAAASGQRIKVRDVDEAIARAKTNAPDTAERSDELRLDAALKSLGEDIRREARSVADQRAAAVSAAIEEVVQIVSNIAAAGFPKGFWKTFQRAGKAAGGAVSLFTQACGEKLPDDILRLVEALRGIHSVSYIGKPVDVAAARRCADDLQKAILGDPAAWGDVGDDPFSLDDAPEFLKNMN